jgi:beta-galactosidase
MYDYNRGYAPDVESSGCMDLFRLPKFSYYFFRSQRAPITGPMVFIASHWMPGSAADVRVFSNCDEVALSLDGRLLERRRPERDRMGTRLAHPPFMFPTGGFRPGRLEAVGYVGGIPVARHVVTTPGPIERLTCTVDLSGRAVDGRRRDILFCHAALRDAQGTVVPNAWENVAFGVTGDAGLVGRNPYSSEAGISSILADVRPGRGAVAAYALAVASRQGAARVLGAALALRGDAPPFELVYTTDGTEPAPGSTRYRGPIDPCPTLRAGLVVQGQVLASLAGDAPRSRIPAAAPPEKREPFHR